MDYQDVINSHSNLFIRSKNTPLEIITNLEIIKDWNVQHSVGGENKDWPYIGIISDDPYYLILRDLIKLPNGSMHGMLRVINKSELFGSHGVVVAPIYQGKFLLLRIFRHAIQKWQLEFPRGFGEPETSPEKQAQIEIEEEIDAKIKGMEFLGIMHSNSGLEYSTSYLFVAYLNSFGEVECNEGISNVVSLPMEDFIEKVSKGEITDSYTLSAFLKLAHNRKFSIFNDK